MHGFPAVIAVLALLAAPLGVAGIAGAAETDGRDLTPVLIGPEPTDRFGGGAALAVKAGDAVFGVRYGTHERPNNLVIFAEYRRFLGAAEIVDAQGNVVRTHGIPVFTLLGQSLDALIEFQDSDADGLLNFLVLDEGTVVRNDLPAKALLLNVSWTLSPPTMETAGGTTFVNFTLSATDLPYTVVWDPLPRRATPEDGFLARLAFTFRLEVRVVDRSGEIPWYRVRVDDGNERIITHVEYLGMRAVAGN